MRSLKRRVDRLVKTNIDRSIIVLFQEEGNQWSLNGKLIDELQAEQYRKDAERGSIKLIRMVPV